jgi:hypothetical protein
MLNSAVLAVALAAPVWTDDPAAPPPEASPSASAPQAVDTLTAEEIVAANVAARGGLDAWRRARSMRMSGRMDAGHGMQVPFTLQLKRGRKMRLEFLFEGQMVVQAYDGKAGWKRQPYLGPGSYALMTAEELKGAAGQADLDGPLIDYRAKGYSVELLGNETVEGRPNYKLAVTLSPGVVRHVYVDAETFLETKVDGTRRLRGNDRKLETFFREYRRVQGLLVPHTVQTKVEGGPAAGAMTIERVELNPPLEDALFAPPTS